MRNNREAIDRITEVRFLQQLLVPTAMMSFSARHDASCYCHLRFARLCRCNVLGRRHVNALQDQQKHATVVSADIVSCCSC
jgi:hypothetical protein